MPSVFVTLTGGSPWGFRIQGGRGTGQPLKMSKVNPGSKAFHQGLMEGDVLRMVNGYVTEGLSQLDVQNIIKETGKHLTLEVERDTVLAEMGKSSVKKKLTFSNSTPTANGTVEGYHYTNQTSSKSRVYQNGSSHGNRRTPSPTHKHSSNALQNEITFNPNANTIVTDVAPPSGAVLLDSKVTVDGDRVHTDKFYAVPVKEYLKEKTTTTRFIPAPPKYEGIGPTEDGIPTSLRQSVKKENMHNWYKTMFKSLHKADSSNEKDEYIIGYSSEPESSKKDVIVKKKASTLDSRYGNHMKTNGSLSKGYPPSAKSSIEVYNVRPRNIEDYEPGYSSVTDNAITAGSKRFLPASNIPKTSYEFKNGYEPENSYIRNLHTGEPISCEQQKEWYVEIQKGGEVPSYGLGKPAPDKPKEPTIGPLPLPPLTYAGPVSPEATRPLSLPADYVNHNDIDTCQQMNGQYEFQVRHTLHSEMQQRPSPYSSSSQLSSPTRSILKSPSRSPDLRIPARALFDFTPESNKEIPLKKGNLVHILRQLDKNWYEGERQGAVGIFPINYVEIVPPEQYATSTPKKQTVAGTGKVLYDFTAQSFVELTVKKGDCLALLRRVDDNWYEARFNNRKGIIPANYIQVLTEPTEKFASQSSPDSHGNLMRIETDSLLKIGTPYQRSRSPNALSDGKHQAPVRGKRGFSLIEPVMYRSVYPYQPQNTDELELLEGDTVCVVEMCDDGWFVGTSVRTGVFGIFPGNYVEKL